MRPLIGVTRVALALAFALALWQAIVWLTGIPHFILPGPGRVAASFWTSRGLIAENAGMTYGVILVGLALGIGLGAVTAIHLALSPLARWLVRPVLVVGQTIPIFALAPIFTLWLGYGAGSKVLMVVLIVYFPVAAAFFDGLMRQPAGQADLASMMGARPLRQMIHLRVPRALPALASGLRLAAVYAPFGAVIGEWVGASRGLGYLMVLANGRAQTDLMFAALVALAAFTVPLYFLVDRLAARLTRRFEGRTI